MTYWITMTDRSFNSSHEGKQLKIIVECDTMEEAEILREYFYTKKKEMRYINICRKKPRYRKEGFEVSYKPKSEFISILEEAM